MSDILFPTDTTGVTPATGDIILIADVSDSNNPKDCTLAELPISTATQTALDGKQATISGLTASGAELNILDGATLSTTELNYVDGVTSSIQTQLDGKQGDITLTTTGSSGPATLIGDTLNIPQYSGGGSVATDAIWDAKGDLAVGTGSNTASRLAIGTNGQVLTVDSSEATGTKWATISGTGDVVGPASSTDNAIARFDSTTGKLIQDSAVTIADTTGDITGGKYNTVAISGSATPTLAVTGTTAVSGTNTGDNATNTTYTTLATTLSTANTWSAIQTFLTGMFGLRNVANTFTSFFTNTNTASRTYTLKDADGTLAFTSDITGTNSGTNTGDQTTIVGITGTMAQFDTAVTDGDFAFLTDLVIPSDEGLVYGSSFNSDSLRGNIVLDSSVSHYHGTVSGATHLPTGGHNGGGAFDFDGVDDYIELNDGQVPKYLTFSPSSTPTGVEIKSDGTKLWVVASSTQDSVYEYNMSIPWDIESATLGNSFSLSTWTNDPTGFSWNNDGTKAYVSSSQADDIEYFTASGAYDITTLSYVGAYSLGVTILAFGIKIDVNGQNFYVVDQGSDIIYQHVMSTPWDMSTASFVRSQSVSSYETTLQGVTFNADGTKMFIIGNTGDDITEFTLSAAWDISTLSPTGVTFYIGAQEPTSAYGFVFGDSGRKIYMVARTAPARIYQYTLPSAYNFSLYPNGLTLSAWISPDSVGETSGRIFDKTDSAGTRGFPLYLTTTNRIATYVDAATSIVNSSNNAITYGAWQKVDATYSGTTATLYVNGVQVGTGTVNNVNRITTIRDICIGNSLATDRTFDGKIDNPRIYNRVLSASEILADYLSKREVYRMQGIPRLTTTMRDAGTWTIGSQIYNLTTNKSQVWNGTTWNDLY